MADSTPSDCSTVWPKCDPDRVDIAAVLGHRLLLVAGIVAAILIVWGSATSPRSTDFGHDITTAVPDSLAGSSTATDVTKINHNHQDLP